MRQIKNDWASDIPAQGIFCILSDVTKVKPFSTEELKKLADCVLDCSLVMKIKVIINTLLIINTLAIEATV